MHNIVRFKRTIPIHSQIVKLFCFCFDEIEIRFMQNSGRMTFDIYPNFPYNFQRTLRFANSLRQADLDSVAIVDLVLNLTVCKYNAVSEIGNAWTLAGSV